MTGLTGINYFSHCCEKTSDKEQLPGGSKIYFNFQCQDVAHHSRKHDSGSMGQLDPFCLQSRSRT